MRYQLQEGTVEERGRGKHKYYCGRYTVYVKDANGKQIRKRPRPFLGYCNQISRSEAQKQLEQLIQQDQTRTKLAEDTPNIHPYNELGRRLLAVIMSHRLGLSSLDYTLKNYVPEVIDPSWAELAAHLDREMANSPGRKYAPKEPAGGIQ